MPYEKQQSDPETHRLVRFREAFHKLFATATSVDSGYLEQNSKTAFVPSEESEIRHRQQLHDMVHRQPSVPTQKLFMTPKDDQDLAMLNDSQVTIEHVIDAIDHARSQDN